jgi:hypothetical protein
MSTSALDPLIHNAQRLRIVATLAALPDGDTVSASRLQTMIGLPPGGPIIGLSELGRAGYVRTETDGADMPQTTIALTRRGREALGRYTAALARPHALTAPAPGMRAGDADREAAAAALAEHFAQGRLTLDELVTRLDATLTATTHGELAYACRDLPDLSTAPVSLPPGSRARPGHKSSQARAQKPPGVRTNWTA